MIRENYDFLDRMNDGKAAAQSARNKGHHVGASAKGWNVERPKLPDDWEARIHYARKTFSLDIADALNDFRAACLNGRNWEEELNAIPF